MLQMFCDCFFCSIVYSLKTASRKKLFLLWQVHLVQQYIIPLPPCSVLCNSPTLSSTVYSKLGELLGAMPSLSVSPIHSVPGLPCVCVFVLPLLSCCSSKISPWIMQNVVGRGHVSIFVLHFPIVLHLQSQPLPLNWNTSLFVHLFW